MHCVLQCNSVAVPWGLIRNNALQQLYSLWSIQKILLPLRHGDHAMLTLRRDQPILSTDHTQ